MKSDERSNALMLFAAVLTVLLVFTSLLVILYPEAPAAQPDADRETLLLWRNQALSAVEIEDFAVADIKAQQILRSMPRDLLALKVRVVILSRQRRLAEAEKICRRIIDDIAIDLEVLNNLGVLRFMQGDKAGAALELQRAAKLAERHPVIRANIMAVERAGAGEAALLPAERKKFPLMLTVPQRAGGKGEQK